MSEQKNDTQTGDIPYRVLIVEDDRPQAVFAEAILRGAGIQSEVVAIPERMMEALERFAPDLVLMDLHMPGVSGTSLTMQIREHPQFAFTPVVFLTGDQDPERELEALEHGGDDYIIKPVRPRHLIAAVQNRIQRSRAFASSKPAATYSERHPETDLYLQPVLMQRISKHLSEGTDGGALLLEISNSLALRNRYGYATFEGLMTDVARFLATLCESHMAARLSDTIFLVKVDAGSDNALERVARQLRDGIGHHEFSAGDEQIKLRCSVGFTTFAHDFNDVGAVIAATEEALRDAQNTSVGIAGFTPKAPEASNGIADEVREALAHHTDALHLVFQPVVAVAGGDEEQFQVLLRMRAPDGSTRRAGEFLQAAQSAGLLPQIDRWVMEQSLDLLQKRRAENRPLRLFVSQAARSLGQDGYADWLKQAVAERSLEGTSLIIDLRLDEATVHVVSLMQFCEQLVPLGVQFCLSQFRNTEDARQLLQELPLGYVRLASEFSHHPLPQEVNDEMREVIDRAHRLGLQVIGQAVEDPQSAAALWVAGIDFIQGHLVQKPEQSMDFNFQSATL